MAEREAREREMEEIRIAGGLSSKSNTQSQSQSNTQSQLNNSQQQNLLDQSQGSSVFGNTLDRSLGAGNNAQVTSQITFGAGAGDSTVFGTTPGGSPAPGASPNQSTNFPAIEGSPGGQGADGAKSPSFGGMFSLMPKADVLDTRAAAKDVLASTMKKGAMGDLAKAMLIEKKRKEERDREAEEYLNQLTPVDELNCYASTFGQAVVKKDEFKKKEGPRDKETIEMMLAEKFRELPDKEK